MKRRDKSEKMFSEAPGVKNIFLVCVMITGDGADGSVEINS